MVSISFTGLLDHYLYLQTSGRPPFPAERRPKSLVCASFNPSLVGKGRCRSLWLEAPCGHSLQVSGCCLAGHLGRCEWSVDWRGTQGLPTKGPTQLIVETVGAGARSQSASAICPGGVSTKIGPSDCVVTLHIRRGFFGIGRIAHCLGWQNRQWWIWPAQAQMQARSDAASSDG